MSLAMSVVAHKSQPLSAAAQRHGLTYELHDAEFVDSRVEKKRPRKMAQKRGYCWKFYLHPHASLPLFKPPMTYLAYFIDCDAVTIGIVRMKHQLTAPDRLISGVTEWVLLERDVINDEISNLYQNCDDEDDLKVFGKPPLSRSDIGGLTGKRSEAARQAAKEGRWDDIPGDLMQRYASNFKAMYEIYNGLIPKPQGSVDKRTSTNSGHIQPDLQELLDANPNEDMVVVEQSPGSGVAMTINLKKLREIKL